ncbi:MAG TPA: histidine kinase [Chitinophagaceae bacterium]|nr:histidine kinase [Chitinophagaceae bacterium]
MRRIYVIAFLLTYTFSVSAQEFKAQQVKGLPTEEIYDLLSDSKGFLWIANSLGLSRYDGIAFVNFHNPEENGFGVTDLLEDKQGRIWCHNFNGQIFYIENEKMYLLHEFKYSEESFFPRLAILGNELIASSEKGLFICNTTNLQCKYLYYNKSKKISSLATVGNTVYVYDGEKWISYRPDRGIQKMSFINKTNELFTNADPALQPIVTSDTIYSKDFKSLIFKFIIKNDTVVLTKMAYEKSFVNNIIADNKTVWINTKKESYSVDNKLRIQNLNLTHIVTDREGNIWYSSLEKGLWVQPKTKLWQESTLTNLNKNDFVRCSQKQNNKILYGTQNGSIIVKNISQKKIIREFRLPTTAGPVENIFIFSNDEFLIAPSIGIYLVNAKWQQIYELSNQGTIKGIAKSGSEIFAAYSRSLSKINRPHELTSSKESYENIYIKTLERNFNKKTSLQDKRCYNVCYDSATKKVFAAFKDGLYEYSNNTFNPVKYNDTIITSLSLQHAKDKLFVGTLNKGVFILGKNGIKNLNTQNGLISNNILELKLIEDQLYIIETNNLKVLDVNTDKIINTIILPKRKSGQVYDVWKENNLLYISSNKALYTSSIKELNKSLIPNCYLQYVTVNDSEILDKKYPVLLPYFKNDIQFKVASPSFTYPDATFFKYRLTDGIDTLWHQTNSNETKIFFSELSPGNYRFEAYAINFQNNYSKKVIYSFQILKPWWQQLWFILIVFVFIASTILILVRFRINTLNKKNNETIEKLNLANELRKSRLSTIKAQMNPHFIFNCLNAIQSFVYTDDKKNATKYLGKFSNLVRNILDNSTKNEITLSKAIELLHLYLDLEKVRFENTLNIQVEIDNDLDTEFIFIPPMLIQPYVENAIVHGLFHKKENRELIIKIKKSALQDYVEISIDDNGIGRKLSNQINKQRKDHIGFANSANQKRIELLNLVLSKKIQIEIIDKKDEFQNDTGTLVILSIPILKTIA